MRSLFKKIKRNAKHALQNNWSKAIAIIFLIAVIWGVLAVAEIIINDFAGISGYADKLNTPGNFFDDLPDISPLAVIISSIFTALSFLVFYPLSVGVCRWNINMVTSEPNEVSDVFYCFMNFRIYIKTLLLGLGIAWRYILYGVLFFALPVLIQLFGISLVQMLDSTLLTVLSSALLIINTLIITSSFVLFTVFIQKYSLAKYILLSNNQLSASRIIKLSAEATKGSRLRLALFKLSFIFNFLICLLLLPLLYVLPYYNASNAIFAKLLLEKHKISLKQQATDESKEKVYYNPADIMPQS